MEYFQIRGAGPLRGETAVSGAKNAALPILAATVLCRGPCVLYNCPEIADVEKTLAIGDSENDVAMLQTAGIGVAMGNAKEHVREIADVVAPDNEHDGVAWTVERLLRGEF